MEILNVLNELLMGFCDVVLPLNYDLSQFFIVASHQDKKYVHK